MPRLTLLFLTLAFAAGPSDPWKTTRDATGTCEVATPPEWQAGRDFVIERYALETIEIGDTTLHLPTPKTLWPEPAAGAADAEESEPVRYQFRTSLGAGDYACSVYRIKTGSEFTADERSTMFQVGLRLKVVKP